MDNSRKTININPDLFKVGNKNKSRKKEKKKKPNIDFKPNKVRKQLLGKIKNYQQKEQDNKKEEEKKEKEQKKHIDKEIINDNHFDKSIDFLQNLSKQKREKKRGKKDKKDKKKREKNYLKLKGGGRQQQQDIQAISTQSYNHTLKNHNTTISNYPQVEIDMPIELQEPCIDIAQKLEEEVKHNTKLNEAPPPYGCLKNGSKPTYRTWKRTTQKYDMSPSIQIESPMQYVYSDREKKLNEMKDKFQISGKIVSNNKFPPLCKSKKYIRKNTIRKKYHLGRTGKKVSILIKDRKTRKQIAHEQTLLKKTPLTEIKIYLRKHNLLKSGSEAPNDVLRHLYEQSVLTGDVHNTCGEVLLHNYMNSE